MLQKLLTFTGIQARQLKSLLEAKFSFIYARSYLMYALMTTNENFYTSESFIEHVFDDTRTTKKDNPILKINQENFRIQKRSCTNAIYKLYKRKIDKDLDKIRTIERTEVPLFQADEV